MLTNCKSCHFYSSESPELGCTVNPDYWVVWQSLKQSGQRLNESQRLIISDCHEFTKRDSVHSLQQIKALATHSFSLSQIFLGACQLSKFFIEEFLLTSNSIFLVIITVLLYSTFKFIVIGYSFSSGCTKNLTLYWQEAKPIVYSIKSLGYENEPTALIYTDAMTGQKRKIISPPPHEVSELICPK